MNILVIFFCIVALAFSAHLPPNIKACSKSDANFDECVRLSAENAFAVLADGNQDLQIPPLDPLYLGSTAVEATPGPISLFQNYTGIVITGLRNFKVDYFKVDLEGCKLHVKGLLPVLNAKGNFAIKGQLLVFPIDASGVATARFDDATVHANATCGKFKKKGVSFLRVVTSDFSLTYRKNAFDFGTLIKGNELLDREVRRAMADDADSLWEIMRPTMESMWATHLKNIVNSVFAKVPVQELFI